MARRVNTRFLFGLTVVIIGLGCTALILQRRASRPNVQKHLDAAREYIKAGNWDGARAEYDIAGRIDPTNKDVSIARGDAYNHLTEDQGFPALEAARTMWDAALAVDPHYKPAMGRLFDSYIDQLEHAPSTAPYTKLQDIASRLAKEDPTNTRAQAYAYIADLEQWESGVGSADKRLLGIVQALADLQKKDPSNADAMYYLSRAKLRLARDARRASDTDQFNAQVGEVASMVDAAVAAQPQNAPLNYRASLVYRGLGSAHAGTEQAKKDRDAAGAALERARANVKPQDSLFSQIQFEAAEWAMSDGRPNDAEKILRDYYQQNPNDQLGRLELAEVLRRFGNPAKREEAIRILKQPVVALHEAGIKGMLVKQQEQRTREDLVHLHLDQYVAATLPSERTQLISLIDDGYKQVSSATTGENVGLLRLKAEIQQAKGQRLEALETLKRAVDLMEHMPNKPPYQNELIYQLANTYRNLGQNRAAEERYQQLLGFVDSFTPARISLIELYLQESNFEEASRQISILEAQSPQMPEVSRLKLAMARMQGNGDASKQIFAQLPEDTAIARDYKAEQAIRLADYPEAIRLLDPALKEKPGDYRTAFMAAAAYFHQNQKDNARQVLKDAMAANPNEKRFSLLLEQVNGATPEQLRALVQKEFEATADPFSREVQLARTADLEGRYDEALRHLKDADTLKPNDIAVWSTYFDVYVRKGDFAAAARTIDVLAPLDNDTNGQLYRWQLAMSQRHFEDAIRIGKEMTDKRSAVSGSWTMLGKAYQASGQFNDALIQYRSALEIQSTNAEAYRGQAQCYYAIGQPEQARTTLVTAVQRLPNDRQLLEMLMVHDTDHDNAATIVPKREQMLASNPAAPESYYALAYTCMAAAEQVFAKDPEQAGKYTAEARDTLSRGVAQFPTNLQLNAKLAELLQKTATFDEGQQVLTKLAATDLYKGKPEALLLLADYCAKAGRNDDAEQYLRQALSASGNNIDLELRLAQHLLGQAKYDAALDVLRTNPDDPRIMRARLQTLVYAKRLDEAEKGVDQALAKSPNSYDLLLLRLGIYVDQQRYREARQVSQQVLKLDPRSSLGLYFQALAELRDPNGGDLELALNSLNTVVTRNPQDVESRARLAEVYLRRHELEPAMQQLEDCLKISPDNREVRVKLVELCMNNNLWSRFTKAVLGGELNPRISSDPIWSRFHALGSARQGDFPMAIEKIQEAITLAKGDPQYDRDFLNILLQSKAYDRVLSETDTAIKDKAEKVWWVYQARAQARASMGDKVKAGEEFDQALAVADTANDIDAATEVFETIGTTLGFDQALSRLAARIDASPHWRLLAVDLNIKAGNWPAVVQAVQPLLDKKNTLPRNDRIRATQFAAEAYQINHDNDKAKSLYLEWLEINPSDRLALNNLAYLLAEGLKNPTEARQYSQRAYDAERRNGYVTPGIADTHAWVLTLCGGADADQGLTMLRSLVDNNPDFVEARYHLGMALLKKQRPTEAEREFNTAAEKLNTVELTAASTTPQLKADIAEGLKKAREMAAAKTDAR